MMQGLNRVLARINEIKTRFGFDYQGNAISGARYTTQKAESENCKEKRFEEALEYAIQSTSGSSFEVDMDKVYSQVKESSDKYNVDPNLILAVMKAESGFNKNAVSRAGAIGLMQLMPQTARSLGINPYNHIENVEGGTLYLKKMMDMFGQDISLALAAYNAGPQNVKKYGGIPPFNETKNYVDNVIKYYNEFSRKD
jgi:soluble lytic murein transglycosylase-like protein